MIPQSDLSWQTQSWQEQMINAVRSPTRLLSLLELSPSDLSLSEQAAKRFPVLVPYSFISRMQKGNANDPLLLQVLNLSSEDLIAPNYSSDPLKESDFNPVKGLIKKYGNRALLIVTGKCAVNCRYCFRRDFPYAENNPSRDDWKLALQYLAEHSEIDEVILSGGDPLSAPDRHLQWLVEALSAIESIERLRIHTRLPVVIPDRITDELTNIFETSRLTTTVVIHSNHANEINDRLETAIRKLKNSVDFLLNQSVLLRNVNDNLADQTQLQRACVEAGILPYYLHFLDPVQGAAHFEVPKEDALHLYDQMQANLSGYMLPKLVVELPGAASKTYLI